MGKNTEETDKDLPEETGQAENLGVGKTQLVLNKPRKHTQSQKVSEITERI